MDLNWQNLSDSEKRTVTVGATALLIIVAYFFILEPFQTSLANLRQQLSYQQQLLDYMHPIAKQLQNYNQQTKTSKTITADLMLSTVSQSLRDNHLERYSSNIAQSNQNKVRIDFNTVPFDQLTQWLSKIWQVYRLEVEQINLNPQQRAGTVKANLILALSNN